MSQDIYYNARIENVPEYRLNAFGKYTLTDTFARGTSLGLGVRYSSETVVSRSVDWNPLAGGYQAGDYLVFDATIGCTWNVLGYHLITSAGVYNLTDEQYSEGSFVQSPARNWLFTTGVRFQPRDSVPHRGAHRNGTNQHRPPFVIASARNGRAAIQLKSRWIASSLRSAQ